MPTVDAPVQLTVEDLMIVVKQLPPAELRKFKRQFAEWQKKNGVRINAETALIQTTKARLPLAADRRLKRLIAKSERGTLIPKELEEYRSLVQQAEQLNGQRVEALVELVRRRGKPVRVVMQEIGWKGGDDGAPNRPARRTAAGA